MSTDEGDASTPSTTRECRRFYRPFTGDPRALAALRDWAARRLAPSELEAGEMASVMLVVSELAANAIIHSAPPRTLGLVIRPTVVRVEVTDGSWEMPVKSDPHHDRARGRGLAMIDRLASRWGAEHTATGKTVWCEVGRGATTGPIFGLVDSPAATLEECASGRR